MPDWSDNDLILYFYGELDAADERRLQSALAEEPELGARLAALTELLETQVPDEAPARDALYGRRVWARVEPQLEQPHRLSLRLLLRLWWSGAGKSRYAVTAGLVVIVAATAFLLGRQSILPGTLPATQWAANSSGDTVRDRVLMQAIANHLDDTQRLLVTISNTPAAAADTSVDQQRASNLLAANRLYRAAAEQAGERQLVLVLADIEPVLTQLSNAGVHPSNVQYAMLRQQIQNRDLLFKIRSTDIALQAQFERPPQLSI